jgi:hypothetical protein
MRRAPCSRLYRAESDVTATTVLPAVSAADVGRARRDRAARGRSRVRTSPCLPTSTRSRFWSSAITPAHACAHLSDAGRHCSIGGELSEISWWVRPSKNPNRITCCCGLDVASRCVAPPAFDGVQFGVQTTRKGAQVDATRSAGTQGRGPRRPGILAAGGRAVAGSNPVSPIDLLMDAGKGWGRPERAGFGSGVGSPGDETGGGCSVRWGGFLASRPRTAHVTGS